MKFVCPVCQTAGDLPFDDASGPAKKTICRKCGTPLSIEGERGRAKALAAAEDLPQASKPSATPHGRPAYANLSILSQPPGDKNKKDYAALAVFVLVLALLIGAGAYFSVRIERAVVKRPLESISRLVEDVSRYGQTIAEEFRKISRSENKPSRQAHRHVRKGYDHYKANRLEKALAELNRAIEVEPQNFEAYFWRGRTWMRKEQFENAIGDFKKVLELNPGYSPAYDNLGWLFMRRNEYDQSLAYLNRSIALKAENGWAHHMRSRIFFKKGDLKSALENAQTACKLGFKDACRDAKSYQSQATTQAGENP